jgi:cytochrome c-type biogenesis protein CcmF
LIAAGALALGVIGAVYVVETGHASLAPLGIGLAIFVMAGAISDMVERTGVLRMPFATVRARAAGLPRSAWGTMIAHFGIGLTLLGIVCETHWAAERIVSVKPGETVIVRHYQLTFDGIVPRQGPNYREQAAKLTVRRNGVLLATLLPAKRSFASRGTTTTEAALLTRGLSQLYVSLGEANDDGSVALRIYHKPLVLLIWLGAVVMALGGGLSLSDRRLRVGAPKPAARSTLAPAE